MVLAFALSCLGGPSSRRSRRQGRASRPMSQFVTCHPYSSGTGVGYLPIAFQYATSQALPIGSSEVVPVPAACLSSWCSAVTGEHGPDMSKLRG